MDSWWLRYFKNSNSLSYIHILCLRMDGRSTNCDVECIVSLTDATFEIVHQMLTDAVQTTMALNTQIRKHKNMKKYKIENMCTGCWQKLFKQPWWLQKKLCSCKIRRSRLRLGFWEIKKYEKNKKNKQKGYHQPDGIRKNIFVESKAHVNKYVLCTLYVYGW